MMTLMAFELHSIKYCIRKKKQNSPVIAKRKEKRGYPIFPEKGQTEDLIRLARKYH